MSSSQQPPEAPAPAAAAATTAEEHLDLVREAMKAKPLMVAPSSSSVRVHKDECVYSFDTPFSPGGLYVNLSTWQVREGMFFSFSERARERKKMMVRWRH